MAHSGLGFWAVAGASSAAAGSYELISTVIVTGANASVTFSSIPQTYKNLQIRAVVRDGYNSNPGTFTVYPNADFGATKNTHYLRGDGTSVTSGTNALSSVFSNVLAISSSVDTANFFSPVIVDVLDYTNPSINKTFRAFGGYSGGSGNRIGLYSSVWLSTAAINQIMVTGANLLMPGSRVSLYGIKG